MKTKQEALDYINGPGVQEAREATKDIQAVTLTKHTMTIAQGTELEAVITRRNGTIELTGHAGNIPLLQPQQTNTSRFHAVVRAKHRRALSHIRNNLSAFLEIRPGEYQNSVYYDPKVQEAVDQAATRAQRNTGTLQEKDSGTAGYQTLHHFLGPDSIERTLHIFGRHADLRHLKLYLDYPEIIEQAYRKFPNTVLMWSTLTDKTMWDNMSPNPYNLAKATHTRFSNECMFRGIIPKDACNPQSHQDQDHPPGHIPFNPMFHMELGTTDADNFLISVQQDTTPHQRKMIGLLWRTFLNLPTEALKETNLEQSHLYYSSIDPILLAKRAIEVGQIPSHTAAATLLQNPYVLSTAPPRIIHSFIKHYSKEQDHTDPEEITKDLRLVHATAQEGNRQLKKTNIPTRLLQLAEKADDEIPDWTDVLNAAKSDVQDLRTPKGRKRATAPKPRGKAPNTAEVDKVLHRPQADDTVLIAMETPTWVHEPGKRLTVFTKHPGTPLFIVEKNDNGTIELISEIPFLNQPVIPKPQRSGPTARNGEARNNVRYMLGLDYTNIGATPAMMHMSGNWENIRPHPDLNRPKTDQLGWAIQSYLHYNKPYQHSGERTGLTKALNNALAIMQEPQVTASAAEHVKYVTIYHYNTFLTLDTEMDELCRTNPGAVSWAMNHATTNEILNHPGQLITLAKTSLTQAGMASGNWKFIASLNHPLIRDTHPQDTNRLITLLNAMAASGNVLDHDTAETMMETIINAAHRKGVQRRNHQEDPQVLLDHNLTAMLTLLCREESIALPEHPGMQNTMDEAMDVLDYVVNLTENGTHLRSTTWKGLAKASHHWHRNTRQATIMAEWKLTLSNRRRKASSWESLIGPTTKGEFHIVPLLNEYQLFQESKEMDHCVMRYGAQCANGDRIFSVQRHGVKVATSQLTQTPHGWRETQTRGRGNHAVGDEIIAAMQEIAQDYEAAQQEEDNRAAQQELAPDRIRRRQRHAPAQH